MQIWLFVWTVHDELHDWVAQEKSQGWATGFVKRGQEVWCTRKRPKQKKFDGPKRAVWLQQFGKHGEFGTRRKSNKRSKTLQTKKVSEKRETTSKQIRAHE